MATSALPPVQECHEFVAAEGRYELCQSIFLDNVLAHPVIPTYVSSVSVKYKDYLGDLTGKQGSAEGILSALNIDRLEEQLKDLKVTDERTADDDENSIGNTNATTTGLAGNFHGNLVNLPLYNDDGSGHKTPKNGMMSPGPPQVVTPGPPPLKDSTSSHRLSDMQLNSQQTSSTFSTKSLGRAASFSHQPLHMQEEGNGQTSSYATIGPSSASSAGFSSFFSGKRKKPKNNIAKTNSTFVAKITTNENLSKILANRVNEDVYVFWNTGRTFSWSDLGQKPNEPLSHISFTKAFPTAHDVNILTRSCDHLDVIIGFSTGDIIWFNPLSNKYSSWIVFRKTNVRLTKDHKTIIKDSAVTMIKWMPGSESQFIASFQDGTMVTMDKDRDDNTFSPSNPPHENSFHATKPKSGRHNPITHWNISRKPVTAFAFSPDLQHVAVVALDGGLRIIDFRHERLIETFQSYFGALNCVCWSPDGKYILTGGQDDLVTIWSFKDLRIVARCQGHHSYVTGVAFDSWRCDERNYRFGSVGEDAKLLLWDFSVGALHKPKAATMQRRGSNGTIHGGGAFKPGHRSKGSITSLRGHGGHSLFSGLNKSSLSQQVTLTCDHASSEDVAVEPVTGTQEGANKAVSLTAAPSISSSIGKNSNLTLDVPPLSTNSESASISAETSSVLSTAVSEDVGDGSSSSNGNDDQQSVTTTSGNSIATEEKPRRKKNAFKQARELPPLQIQHQHVNNSSNGGGTVAANNSKGGEYNQGNGLSSLFYSQRQQQQQQQQQQLGESAMRPPEPRSHVAMLQPLMAVAIHNEPLASITFREDAIMTSDRRGYIKVWKRPSVEPLRNPS
ncbi:hypothetical protein BGX26_011390 [Mortierella sp. AD094]|nr:hypothetical protein BGX26_011390 [Mortierella sp. AD094]